MDKFIEKKPWGNFEQYSLNEISTIKIIHVNNESKLSLQYHHNRNELWRVIEGSGQIIIDDKIIEAKKDDEFYIPKKAKHRIIGGVPYIKVLEISFGEFDEKDIVRLEDDYDRV
jgi:mannose-6-phosphate isomerase-like protein (cupin superfamily)